MADALEQAALAFDADMGNRPAPRSSGGSSKGAPVESMFDNLGEETDNSEPVAGGDHDIGRSRKPKKQEVEEEEEEGFFDPDSEDDDEEGEESGEADEDADEDEDEGDEGDPDEEEALLGRKFAISVDGEETEVTLREALDGYIRRKTFDQRLNKVAEVDRAVRENSTKLIKARDLLVQEYEVLEQQMKSIVPAEPDWEKLYAEDPAKARATEKAYKEYMTTIEGVRAKQQQIKDQAAAEAAEALREYTIRENKRFIQTAKFKTQEEFEKNLKSMHRTALNAGFSDEEVAEVVDSRMLMLLLKASKYDRMMASKPKMVKTRKETPKSHGAGRVSTAPKGVARAQKQLAKTGSIEDAAAVFETVLNPRRR